jgi:hypothetical protein
MGQVLKVLSLAEAPQLSVQIIMIRSLETEIAV